MTVSEIPSQPGVYATDDDGAWQLVHLYQGGDYGLADVVELFELGREVEAGPQAESAIELTRRELDRLKRMADAYSFDYEEPFIEMCHEMYRFSLPLAGEAVRFVATF